MKTFWILVSMIHYCSLTLGAQNLDYKVLSRWTVQLSPADSALMRHQRVSFAEPLVVGDKVFLGTEKPLLEARSLKTGRVLWLQKLDGAVQGAWSSANGVLYGGDTEGQIYAVESESGKIMWKAASKGLFVSRPLVTESLVIVMTSSGSLQAYDRASGAWRWQQSDPKRANLALISHGGPQTFMDLVISGFPSGILLGIDPQSGDSRWSEAFAESIAAPIALNDIKALYTNDDYLLASSFAGSLKAWRKSGASKKLLWEKNHSLYDSPTFHDGRFYISARDGKVYALDESTGFQIWSYEVPRGLAHRPVIQGDQVWIATTAGDLLVLNLAGELLARKENIEVPYWTAPVPVGDGFLLALSSRGLLRNLRLVKTR